MARSFVGLDLGHHTVRAVALRRTGRAFELTGFGAVRRRDDDGQVRPLAEVLKELGQQLPLGRSPVVAHGDLDTLVKYVGTIPLAPDRLQRLLRLELLQAIEATELAADTFPVPLASDELIHCCVLTQPTNAYEALKGLAASGIVPAALHVAQAAVYNATVPLPPVQDDDLALLVDIGATTTSVALFGDRRLLACRQLAVGGDTFTAAIGGAEGPVTAAFEQSLRAGAGMAPLVPAARPASGRSPAVAARPASGRNPVVAAADDGTLELDDGELSLPDDAPLVLADDEHQDGAGADPTGGLHFDDGGEEAPVGATTRLPFEAGAQDVAVPAPGRATQQIASRTLGPDLTRVAENLYGQLASSLAWFGTQIHAKRLVVTRVLLTGGGAGLDGLETYLQRRFNLPVARFDPCDGLTGRVPERPYEFATAIGLAVAAADAGGAGISGTCRLDLTPDGVLRQRLWRTTLVWPYVAAACLVLSAVLAGWTMLNEQWVAQANLASFASFQQRHDELKAKLDALGKERDGLSEDLRAIAGRMYAGRDLLYTVRALKEQTLKSQELWITSLETVDIAGDADVSDAREATTPSRGLAVPRPAAGEHKGARRDTAIDRGAVDVEGLVRFDDKRTDVQMNRFFEDYNAAIGKWQLAADAPGLFRDDRVLVHLLEHADAGKPAPGGRVRRQPATASTAEPGRFPFKLRFFFQSTRLDDITSDGPVSQLPKAAAPAAAPRAEKAAP